MDMNLSKLQEIVQDREISCAAVMGLQRVGHNDWMHHTHSDSQFLKVILYSYYKYLLYSHVVQKVFKFN